MMFSPALMRVSDLPQSARNPMHVISMRSVASHPLGHLTASHQNPMRKFAESMLQHTGMVKAHATMVWHSAVKTGVAAGTGATLGAISATRTEGLDVTVRGKKVPMDIVGGTAVALLTPLLPASFGLHGVVVDAAATAVGIGTFRKSHDFFAEKRLAHGGAAKPAAKVAGEDDELIAMAQRMRAKAA